MALLQSAFVGPSTARRTEVLQSAHLPWGFEQSTVTADSVDSQPRVSEMATGAS